ncbi:hypothetical protein MUG78_17045 [Gordonia alkaliphila]|uniref:hypothetical protein n=1 Tax=Gordonia alkaliphila TaxID=1053547 RepID=UPI001FF31270|nr:hypothetical protein [Gordonia alkaliphila]MCK0441108.1 hypothetical protein [Gordonia alkaliphila]
MVNPDFNTPPANPLENLTGVAAGTQAPRIQNPVPGADYAGPDWLDGERIAATIGGTMAATYMARGRIPGLGGSRDEVREFRELADAATTRMNPLAAADSGKRFDVGQMKPWSDSAGRAVATSARGADGLAHLAPTMASNAMSGVLAGSAGQGAVYEAGEAIGQKFAKDWQQASEALRSSPGSVVSPADVNSTSVVGQPAGAASSAPVSGVDSLTDTVGHLDSAALGNVATDSGPLKAVVQEGLEGQVQNMPAAQRAMLTDAFDQAPRAAVQELNAQASRGVREGLEQAFVGMNHTPAEAKKFADEAMKHLGSVALKPAEARKLLADAVALPERGALRAGTAKVSDWARHHGVSAVEKAKSLKAADNKIVRATVAPSSRAMNRFLRPNTSTLRHAATNPASKAALKEVAKTGGRLGVLNAARMGAVSIPVAGWVIGAVTSAAFWVFDPEERGMWKSLVENMKSGWWGGANTPDIDAKPWFPETQWYPLCADGNRDPAIRTADQLVSETMLAAFGIESSADIGGQDNGLWRLDAYPSMKIGDGGIDKATRDFQNLSNTVVADVDALLSELTAIKARAQNEPMVDQVFKAGLDAAMKNIDELATSILPSLTNLQSAAGIEASNLWGQISQQNGQARETIAKSNQGMSWNPMEFFGLFSANELQGSLGDVSGLLTRTQEAVNDTQSKTRPLTNGWALSIQTTDQSSLGAGNPARERNRGDAPTSPSIGVPASPSPISPVSPSAPSPSAPTSTKPGLQETIKDILASQPAQTANNQAANAANDLARQFGQMMTPNAFGGGMNPFQQFRQQQYPQSPLTQSPYAPKAQPAAVKKPDLAAKPAAPAAAVPKAADQPNKAEAPAASKPAPAVPPKAAVPATTAPSPGAADKVDTAAADTDERGSHKVKVGEHEVSLPSAKHADLLKQMMSTDGQQHPSVREAAQRAGFDLPPENSDIGQRVPSPAKLQPGDVIIGDKAQGVYTGDGRVYTTDGKEIPLSKMSMSGPHQGLFHLAGGDDGGDPPRSGDGGDKPDKPDGQDKDGGDRSVDRAAERRDSGRGGGSRPPAAL